MGSLNNKHVLLGVTGSIAAYKSADLVRQLVDAGAEVQVVMTEAATGFITPLTLQTLSGRPVRQTLVDVEAEAMMGHITLARWADVILVAPAGADFLARLVQGRAEDLLAAVCLAADCPLAVAPAMNQQMWANAATQDNLATLMQRNIHVLGPAEGMQACGETGLGRMMEPLQLVDDLMKLFKTGELAGLRVLVNAGPTREDIDPVRYISNRSSGKMGFAIAQAASEAGATVTLVSGPVSQPTPERVTRMDVYSADEMYQQVMAQVQSNDVFIACAAVADYRPLTIAEEKIKKDHVEIALSLIRNSDIVCAVTALENAPFTLGFAAETWDVENHAQQKMATKSLDMIAANRVGEAGSGFDSDDNALSVYWPGGSVELPLASKTALARTLITHIATRYYEKHSAQNS